jgi:formate dehydrogenase major subunit
MEKSGITVSRWIDGVLENKELIDQPAGNLRAVVYWGHAPNSQTRGAEMVEAMKKLDTLVVIDPYPSATAAMAAMVRKDGVYLLPACTQFETHGSAPRRTARSSGARRSSSRCSSPSPTTPSCTPSRRSSAGPSSS